MLTPVNLPIEMVNRQPSAEAAAHGKMQCFPRMCRWKRTLPPILSTVKP